MNPSLFKKTAQSARGRIADQITKTKKEKKQDVCTVQWSLWILDKSRILLAIFPAHATHTLQPLDVAIISPLSTNYTKQLDAFIKDSHGFTRVAKCDLFRPFWASWDETFTSKNINSAFRNTGLYPFNPELVIQKFTNKPAVGHPQVNLGTQLF
jgi:hypothetical protein